MECGCSDSRIDSPEAVVLDRQSHTRVRLQAPRDKEPKG
jgi:hypothetical protein